MSIIIDSNLSFDEALLGKDIPEEILSTLTLCTLPYRAFDGRLHQG